jgi:threonine dehydrogenase-like Zn-dependent dehydrogenase
VEEIQLAVQAIASGRLDLRPLYTHTVSLGNLAEAFELTATRPVGFLKALVTE